MAAKRSKNSTIDGVVGSNSRPVLNDFGGKTKVRPNQLRNSHGAGRRAKSAGNTAGPRIKNSRGNMNVDAMNAQPRRRRKLQPQQMQSAQTQAPQAAAPVTRVQAKQAARKGMQEAASASVGPMNGSAPKQLQKRGNFSMKQLNDTAEQPLSKRQARKAKKAEKKLKKEQRSRFRKVFSRTIMVGGSLAILAVGFLGIKTYLALDKIFVANNGDGAIALQGDIDPTELSGEGDGRVNIMLVGIGGEEHTGGDLADTIIVASIDPFANELAMISIPRDTYVTIPEYGANRINASHAFGEQYGFEQEGYTDGGIGLAQVTIEETLGIPIHYFIRVDFEAFKQAVDTVGGLTLNLEEPLYDTHFINGFGILDLPAGENYFDGETALFYARSRYTSPRGDFDRNDRQREILLALKDKVLSLNTFTSPGAITGLLDTAGSHVRTNLSLGEILRINEILGEIDAQSVVSVGLDNSPDNYLASSTVEGASVLVPKEGVGDFSEIQRYVRELFVDGFIRSEAAEIDVLNGSEIIGAAGETADELRSFGYSIQAVADAPTEDYTQPVTIYDLSGGQSPYTKRYLEQRFNVTVVSAAELDDTIETESAYVIILGNDQSLTP